MMTKMIRRLLITAALFAACMIPARKAYAVPAENGNMSEGHCRSHVFDLAPLDELPSDGPVGAGAGGKNGSKKAKRRAGSSATPDYIPLVMIVVGFEGQPYNDSYDWSQKIFKEENSLARYYSDMSYGQFTFVPVQETSAGGSDGNTNLYDQADDGIIHLTLDTVKKYGWDIDLFSSAGRKADEEMTERLSQALGKADAYMNAADYDSNGDGVIQNTELAVGFVVAGKDAAKADHVTAYSADYVWPHAWSFSEAKKEPPVLDGRKVDGYIAISEYGTEGVQEDIGVLAHELGHYLGLPDLYSIENGHYGWYAYEVGDVSLMDHGLYGQDADGNMAPYSLDVWSRMILGWIEPVQTEGGVFQMAGIHTRESALADGQIRALQINTGRDGEYYLLENRRFTGWDAQMGKSYPAAPSSADGKDQGGGIILWHIDDQVCQKYQAANTVNNLDHRPAVMPLFREEKDGKTVQIGTSVLTKEPFYDRESWGDPFYLPVYGDTDSDLPADRLLPEEPWLDFVTASGPVMQINVHSFTGPVYEWSQDNSVVTARKVCRHDESHVQEVESVKTKVAVTTEPGCSSSGEAVYTAAFTKEGLQTQEKTVVLPPTGIHVLEKTEAKDPTCEEEGNRAYWTCRNCGKHFSDEEGTDEIESGSWVLPKLETPAETEAGASGDPAGGSETEKTGTDPKEQGGQETESTGQDGGRETESQGQPQKASGEGTESPGQPGGQETENSDQPGGEGTKSPDQPDQPEESAVPKTDRSGDAEDSITKTVSEGASADTVDKAVRSLKSDADPAGAVFRKLRLRSSKQTKKSITLSWKKVRGARKYIIYANHCGKKNKLKKLTSTRKRKLVIKKVAGKGIKKGNYYKFLVAAVDKNNRVITTSKIAHVAAKGGKVTNPRSISTRARKNKLTLKKGKKFRLRAKVKSADAGKKLRTHRKLCYESSGSRIATVSRSGLIRARRPGSCYIYVYAQNGVCRKIRVKVVK